MIDSGVAYRHPDLAGRMWDGSQCLSESGTFLGGCIHGYDFRSDDRDPNPDDSDHGTHVAGTIAAAINGTGVVGVSQNVRIMALKAGGNS